jgi:hypothetical protein
MLSVERQRREGVLMTLKEAASRNEDSAVGL